MSGQIQPVAIDHWTPFELWPARLYTADGVFLQDMRVAYALRVLVSDDYRIFIHHCVIDGVIRFREADPALERDYAIVADTFRQLDMAGP